MNENRIQGGYILLSRKIIESEIWNKPPLYLKIWIYLLSRAQFKNYNGLERGQVFFSIPEIQEACSHYVGFRKEIPSYDQVRKAVEWMKQASNTDNGRFSYEDQYEDQVKTSMITTTKTTRGIVANIVNYNVYQDPKSYVDQYEDQYEDRTKTERRPKGAQTIDKNDKNDKNVRNNIVEQYPYKEIIDYLNQTTGSNYSYNTEKTKQLIKARMNEGQKVEDFKRVIDNKVKSWKGTEWQQYLRPTTLFGTKFEGYLNEKPKTSNNQSNVKKQKPQIIEDDTTYEERQAFLQKKLAQKIPINYKNRR